MMAIDGEMKLGYARIYARIKSMMQIVKLQQ
jgi:hypothetical protein